MGLESDRYDRESRTTYGDDTVLKTKFNPDIHPVNIGGVNPNPKPTPLDQCPKEDDLTEADFPDPTPLPVHLL